MLIMLMLKYIGNKKNVIANLNIVAYIVGFVNKARARRYWNLHPGLFTFMQVAQVNF